MMVISPFCARGNRLCTNSFAFRTDGSFDPREAALKVLEWYGKISIAANRCDNERSAAA
jgi:hypothetical protein